MKLIKSVIASILCLCLAQAFPVLAVSEQDTIEEEIICPDSNPLNCYPKNFIPTEDWQIVKQGQVIPPGLEVKLDLENMNREARLIKDQGNQLNKKRNHDIIISNGDPNFQNLLENIKELVKSESINNRLRFDKIIEDLDVLVDWSSDLETGAIIAQNIQPLLKLSGLYHTKNTQHNNFGFTEAQYIKVQEMIYRILASSFRNNIEAQEILLNFLNEPDLFLVHLVSGDEKENDVVIKRKLGLLGSLLNNGLFTDYFQKGEIDKELIILYPKVESKDIKLRIMTILDDIKLVRRDERDEDDQDDVNLDKEYAIIVQNTLVKSSLNDDPQSREMLISLSELKKKDKLSFRADNKFLDWMDRQITKQRENVNELRKRDVGEDHVLTTEHGYLNELITLRHEVFGNPLGSRKEYIDEL